MAASLVLEEEHGTFDRKPRRHNGYFGGDFSTTPYAGPARPSSSETAWRWSA